MVATTSGTASRPWVSMKLVTVDDEVKVMTSASASKAAAAGSGAGATVR